MSSTVISIFYSWQSDLPRDTNQNLIRHTIQEAITHSEETIINYIFKLDEATRSLTGSPDIPASIFNKIDNCDIFICDVTTINNSEQINRKVPNPNVLIELGYAIATIGWERIIMVFNKKFGDFTTELPFDLEKRRLTTYSVADKADKSGKNNLKSSFVEAFKLIIDKNPIKKRTRIDKSPGEIKRIKDIQNISNLFKQIHIPTIDEFIDEMPYKMIGRIFWFWEGFRKVFESNSFYIFDEATREHLTNFRISWGKTFNFPMHYNAGQGGKDYFCYIPMDRFPNEKSEKDYNELESEIYNLKILFRDLLIYIREKYVEIDIDELSDVAIQTYIEFEKESLSNLKFE